MSQIQKRGLGKGFGALLPDNFNKNVILSPEERIEKIDHNKIKPNPNQPRKHFEQKNLDELSESIKRYGIIQPILVTPDENGNYIIVAGERRWRASKLAGLTKVPAVVRKRKDLDQLEIALIENVQRVDLSALEQAISIERLHLEFNISYEEVAKRLGKGKSTVTNIVRLLNLPESAKKALNDQLITEGHARQILALNGIEDKQEFLLKSIINNGWSVRQAEQFVTSIKAGENKLENAKTSVINETPETKSLSNILGSKVTLKRMANGGKLEIGYKDDKDLSRIINLLK